VSRVVRVTYNTGGHRQAKIVTVEGVEGDSTDTHLHVGRWSNGCPLHVIHRTRIRKIEEVKP
jgi:hypothetical protein